MTVRGRAIASGGQEIPRTLDEGREWMESELKANPGRWYLYSDHQSRGAANSRRQSLKNGPTFGPYQADLEWRVTNDLDASWDVEDGRVVVLVRWK